MFNKIFSSKSVSRTIYEKSKILNSIRLKSKDASTAETKPTKSYKLADLLIDPHPEKSAEVKIIDHVTNKELNFYDPPYLAREAPFPFYDAINLSLKGYEYSVLENYIDHVKKVCQDLDIEMKSHAAPARSLAIKTFQLFGSGIEREYSLKVYERVITVKNLKSTMSPLLFEIIQMNLPEGVQFKAAPPSEEEELFRYIPDLDLRQLKEEMNELNKNK